MSVLKDRARNALNLVKTRALNLPETTPEGENDTPESREVNRRAAAESIVLFKNEAGVLPIRNPGRVVVIGPNATEELYCGGGSSTVFPYCYVSALAGIKTASSDLAPPNEVVFSQGCFKHELLPLLESESDPGRKGLRLEFFNRNFTTDQKLTEVYTETARMLFLDCLLKEAGQVAWIRCTGTFQASVSGIFEFGIVTTGRARLYIDGALLVDNWDEQKRGPSLVRVRI